MCQRCTQWLAGADQHVAELVDANTDRCLAGLREAMSMTHDQVGVFNIMFNSFRTQSAGDPEALETFIGMLVGALMRIDRDQRRNPVHGSAGVA